MCWGFETSSLSSRRRYLKIWTNTALLTGKFWNWFFWIQTLESSKDKKRITALSERNGLLRRPPPPDLQAERHEPALWWLRGAQRVWTGARRRHSSQCPPLTCAFSFCSKQQKIIAPVRSRRVASRCARRRSCDSNTVWWWMGFHTRWPTVVY